MISSQAEGEARPLLRETRELLELRCLRCCAMAWRGLYVVRRFHAASSSALRAVTLGLVPERGAGPAERPEGRDFCREWATRGRWAGEALAEDWGVDWAELLLSFQLRRVVSFRVNVSVRRTLPGVSRGLSPPLLTGPWSTLSARRPDRLPVVRDLGVVAWGGGACWTRLAAPGRAGVVGAVSGLAGLLLFFCLRSRKVRLVLAMDRPALPPDPPPLQLGATDGAEVRAGGAGRVRLIRHATVSVHIRRLLTDAGFPPSRRGTLCRRSHRL